MVPAFRFLQYCILTIPDLGEVENIFVSNRLFLPQNSKDFLEKIKKDLDDTVKKSGNVRLAMNRLKLGSLLAAAKGRPYAESTRKATEIVHDEQLRRVVEGLSIAGYTPHEISFVTNHSTIHPVSIQKDTVEKYLFYFFDTSCLDMQTKKIMAAIYDWVRIGLMPMAPLAKEILLGLRYVDPNDIDSYTVHVLKHKRAALADMIPVYTDREGLKSVYPILSSVETTAIEQPEKKITELIKLTKKEPSSN